MAAGTEAFRWTPQSGMIGLGDLPGGNHASSARAVAADGAVVVGHGFDESGQRAFRWTQTDGMTPLPKLSGQYVQRAFGCSWAGDVIVGEAGAGSRAEAFYWTADDGTRWLAEVLDEHGVVVPEGWNLDRATAVSADGRTIVGYGVNPRGFTEGWVAYLGPTCRADYDENGATDQDDFTSYLAAWLNRSIFADWNYDGQINTLDFIAFLHEWARGC